MTDGPIRDLARRDAARWGQYLLPWWVPGIVLVAAWAGAVAFTAVADDRVCSPADPCGVDPVFAAGGVLLLLAPVLLWWVPPLGLLAGAGFCVLDTLVDPIPSSRVTWLGFGLACLAAFWLHTRDVDRQRALSAGLAGPATLRLPPGLRPIAWDLRLPASGALLVTSALLLWHHHTVAGFDRQHLDAAAPATATVVRVEGTTRVAIETPDGAVHVVPSLQPHAVGQEVPVLVDPGDATWVQLVAEPQDDTVWLTGGLALLLVAALLLWRSLALRRHARHLREAGRPALRVLVDSDGVRTRLYAVDARADDPPFAVLGTLLAGAADRAERAADIDHHGWDDDGAHHGFFGRARAEEAGDRRPGLVVGDLHEGAWPAVLVDDDWLLPATPLRRPRLTPSWIQRLATLARPGR